MKTSQHKMNRFLILPLLVSQAISMPILAQISQLPPLVKTLPAPNIMYTIDDSGSMSYEQMPDYITGNNNYFSNVWELGKSDANIESVRFRTPTINTIYYNPNVKYEPWVNADGTSMPNAIASAAKNHPANATTVNLTINKRARYFIHNPAGAGCANPLTALAACFTEVLITSDPQLQNFANWYQYHRSRIALSRFATGKVFAAQSSALRVGWGALHADSNNYASPRTYGTNQVVVKGVSNFDLNMKTQFLDFLYNRVSPGGGTPLQLALDQVGQYFQDRTMYGPWQNTPGTRDVPGKVNQYSCRKNFHILMTDGMWNSSATINASGQYTTTDGPTHAYAGSDVPPLLGYKAVPPYKDGASQIQDTLASIATYYWSRDLRPDMANNVPYSNEDPAYWQHLSTYTIGLGINGVLLTGNRTQDQVLADLTAGRLQWPVAQADSATAVDDLFHAAVNSRGKYFTAKNQQEFTDALTKLFKEIENEKGSVAAMGSSSSFVVSGGKLYATTFDTANWTGTLRQLNINASGGIDANPDWVIDQGNASAIPSNYTARKIFTYKDNATKGVRFEYANLTTSNQSIFDTAASTLFNNKVTGTQLVDYIRGDKSKEIANNGPLRNRAYLLGDLIGSGPQYVGQGENEGYIYSPDSTGTNSSTNYFKFYSETKKNRVPMVYVGANDGMLHAFRASDGIEQFAYVPKSVTSNLPKLADKAYKHQYYVDGTPNVVDAFKDGSWKTLLLGSTGAGGRGVFVLDITDGMSFNASNVLYDVSEQDDPDIGYTLGRPQLARLPSGGWAVIFGNGFQSNSKKAMLFILNLNTGALSKVDTGAGSNAAPNGLSTPRLVLDSTGTVKSAYAGDMLGNLWKFDFTGGGTPTIAFNAPLFTAKNGVTNAAQPIFVQPDVLPHPKGGFMVTFGTGKMFEVNDSADTAKQTLYGVWDKSGIVSVTPTAIGGRANLQQQTLTEIAGSVPKQYSLTNNAVDWTTKRGWFIDLLVNGERTLINPTIVNSSVLFTTINPLNADDPCSADGSSNNFFFNAITGASFPYPVFDTNNTGTIDGNDAKVSGMSTTLTQGQTVLRRKGGISIVKVTEVSKDGNVKTRPDNLDTQRIRAMRLWRQILDKE